MEFFFFNAGSGISMASKGNLKICIKLNNDYSASGKCIEVCDVKTEPAAFGDFVLNEQKLKLNIHKTSQN